jgi:hypothetical protein
MKNEKRKTKNENHCSETRDYATSKKKRKERKEKKRKEGMMSLFCCV